MTVYAGSEDKHLYALTTAEGKLKWRFLTGGQLLDNTGGPAVGSDGTVYVGADDNRLYAVTAQGKLKWSFLGNGPMGPYRSRSMNTSPVVDTNGTVYVASHDGNLYAVTSADLSSPSRVELPVED